MRRSIAAGSLALLATLLALRAPFAAPSNDDIDGATPIVSLPFSDTPDLADATPAPSDPTDCGSNGTTVWYRYTPTKDGVIDVDASASSNPFDTLVGVYAGTPGNLVLVGCGHGYNPSAIARFQAAAGNTYYIMERAAHLYSGETFALSVFPPSGATG